VPHDCTSREPLLSSEKVKWSPFSKAPCSNDHGFTATEQKFWFTPYSSVLRQTGVVPTSRLASRLRAIYQQVDLIFICR
jgi:hypothetical protein